MTLQHRNGGEITALTHVAHETYKGVASWHFIGDVKWSDGTESKGIEIGPNALCGEPAECRPLFEQLNAYLSEVGEWHDTRQKRDGRVYSWSPKEPRGKRALRRPLTLEGFRASGRDVEDLRTVADPSVADVYEVATPGRIYAGGLVIESNTASGETLYSLTIANQVFPATRDLASLERELFEYGLREQLFSVEDELIGEMDELIAELRDYCAAQGLPHEAADDLLAVHPLSADQREWLTKFCARWHEAVGR